MRYVGLAVVAACGAPSTSATIANRAAPDTELGQKLAPLVIAELGTCTRPHHVTLTLDRRLVADIAVDCPRPPPPGRQVVIVTGGSEPIEGPRFMVAPGHHVIAARDDVTRLATTFAGDFPLYSTRAGLADIVLVIDNDDGIRAGPGVRALLVIL